MKIRGSKGLSLRQRALVIAGALFSLCISASVGPRLLPLPNLSFAASFKPALNTAFSSSRTPGNTKQNAHIQMSAGSQYRTRDRDQQVQVGAHATQTPLSFASLIRTCIRSVYQPFNFKTPSLSLSSGRSPPKDAEHQACSRSYRRR
jgi:hypothetical protein